MRQQKSKKPRPPRTGVRLNQLPKTAILVTPSDSAILGKPDVLNWLRNDVIRYNQARMNRKSC